jgi:hypothetical protein
MRMIAIFCSCQQPNLSSWVKQAESAPPVAGRGHPVLLIRSYWRKIRRCVLLRVGPKQHGHSGLPRFVGLRLLALAKRFHITPGVHLRFSILHLLMLILHFLVAANARRC